MFQGLIERMIKALPTSYISLILTSFLTIALLRGYELLSILINHTLNSKIVIDESFGLLSDLTLIGIVSLVSFPLYRLINSFSTTVAKILFLGFVLAIAISHFVVLSYFVYQLIPLDTFLFQYSWEEITFTLHTSQTNLWVKVSLCIALVIVILFTQYTFNRPIYRKRFKKSIILFVLISPLLYFSLQKINGDKGKFFVNKTSFFVSRIFHHLNTAQTPLDYSLDDFQDLYPEKNFTSKQYPLTHQVDTVNKLDHYFNKFDSSPNIVILIIEGLSDEYLHPYQGADLMPFLSHLKTESLYWNKCFTLGERSFAAVPSIVGGLPYGKQGFTLLEQLPRHLSLVSILKANGYHTSFFYGQGSWFHQKGRFFKHNGIDLLFDKNNFSEDYKKIVVGDDHFFWGYNDKDLFNQSLKVLDTLDQKPRLDIYFSGTTHSPFVISEEDHYDNKLKSITKDHNKEFFTTYNKYLKSLLFADDALKDFFSQYKQREDYYNTVFIITGDHPMTELPRKNSLKRYHVPLLIFSKNLKQPVTFNNTVSHLDIPNSVLTLLKEHNPQVSTINTSLGKSLVDNSPARLAFMNDNREIIDYYSNGHYLSGDELFFVDDQLQLTNEYDKKRKKQLQEELRIFKQSNLYTSLNNKLISLKDYLDALHLSPIHSLQSNKDTTITAEYYNLSPSVTIPNKDLFLDIELTYHFDSEMNIPIVYEITNDKNQSLLWRTVELSPERSICFQQLKINKLDVPDTNLTFNCYIWNKEKIDLKYSYLDLVISAKDD